MKNKDLENLKEKLLKKSRFKKAYINQDLASEIGQRIFDIRVQRGWSQEKLAKKIGTKQPSIARAERGIFVPSLPMLQKIARALKTKLELPKFINQDQTVYFEHVTLDQYLSSPTKNVTTEVYLD